MEKLNQNLFKFLAVLFLILPNLANTEDKFIYSYQVKVIDGDSIEIKKEKIRLFGIDAPEKNQICSKNSNSYNCGLTSTQFLKEIIKQLNLNVKVLNQNFLEQQNKFMSDVFVARAFKPLKTILELMHNKAENWKKIFIFLGKTGKSELLQASKSWDIEYKQRVSVTSNDSIVIEINRLKKK